jgi:hypothetical protein
LSIRMSQRAGESRRLATRRGKMRIARNGCRSRWTSGECNRGTGSEYAMDMITSICELAERSLALPHVSMADHFDQSGYRESLSSLTVKAIAAHLRANPQLIESWLRYSGDQRVSSGWYLVARKYAVELGSIPDGKRKFYFSRSRACAEFIIRVVRSLSATA